MADAIVLLAPWSDPRGGDEAERELRREVSAGHLLSGRPVRAIARRHDRDDVLFEAADTGECFVVHLTWSSRAERPPLPATHAYASVSSWAATRMLDDHADFENGG
ncbi:MAG TPA: hypothetical protein VLT47_06720 [Anaeromyxobacteraceae bacterium]|nr:hypothetical protein [Anaeromyxobacteraceae bacterium]